MCQKNTTYTIKHILYFEWQKLSFQHLIVGSLLIILLNISRFRLLCRRNILLSWLYRGLLSFFRWFLNTLSSSVPNRWFFWVLLVGGWIRMVVGCKLTILWKSILKRGILIFIDGFTGLLILVAIFASCLHQKHDTINAKSLAIKHRRKGILIGFT